MSNTRPRRSLALAEALLVTTAVVLGLTAVTQVACLLTGRTPVAWWAPGAWAPAVGLIPTLTYLELGGTRNVSVGALPLDVRGLACGSVLLGAGMTVLVLLAARTLVREVAAGQPFRGRSDVLLRRTAVMVLAATILRVAIDEVTTLRIRAWFETRMSTSAGPSAGLGTASAPVSWALVLAAVVAWALSVAYREGSRLARETDGLV